MQNYDALKLENQLCFPLYAAAKEIVRKYKPFLDKIGLTYTQYIAMMALWEKDNISVKSLGEQLYLDSGTLTPLLKNLVKSGYVEQNRSSDDGRCVIVSLTPKGAALKEKALVVPQKMSGCINLLPEEAGQLYALLYKILKPKGEKNEHL